MSDHPPVTADVRLRILAVTSKLIAEGGAEAATTRAVAQAAEVQAPTIYRLFGDKAGLLNAVAEQTLANFVAEKARRTSDVDPLIELRHAWDDYIAFHLANPAVFRLTTSRPTEPSKAETSGLAVLAERVRRVAAAGRLRVTEEQAVDLIHAMGTGALFTMLNKPAEKRESLSQAARDAVFSAVITDVAPDYGPSPAGAASALRARLDETVDLSPGERGLLDEWLERIARTPRTASNHQALPTVRQSFRKRLDRD